MDPNSIAALMEADGKKHIIILKPLMSKEDPQKHRKRINKWRAQAEVDQEIDGPDVDPVAVPAGQVLIRRPQRRQGLRNTPAWKAAYDRHIAKQEESLPPIRDKERVIEADYVVLLNDGSLAMGINPGTFVHNRRGFHGEGLRKKRQQHDLYSSIVWDQGLDGYIVTQKFEKILTANVDNVVSVDGKPLIGGSRTMDRGVQHLEDDEQPMDFMSSTEFESKLNEAAELQPQQPKKYRIVMKRGTIIDADHIAPLVKHSQTSDAIYLVGIDMGPGETHVSRLRHPIPNNDDFWHPTRYKHSNPNAPCEIDAEGFHNHQRGDPHHTDYYTVPKFQKVISMHAKNIQSINGKPILYLDDTGDAGVQHLGEGWSIDNISNLLED